MNRWKLSFFCLLAIVVFLAGIVLAGFSYESNNIVTNYSAGDKILGTFNVSFDDEKASSILTSNFEGNISLLDFLNANNLENGNNYTCSTVNCLNSYSAQNQENVFAVQQSTAGKIGGFKITGSNVFINDVSLTVSSNTQSSCSNQISIDIFDDGSDLILNTAHENESCGVKHGGCFSGVSAEYIEILDDREFCETINLPTAPAYFLGAKVKNGTGGYSPLEMTIYDFNTNKLTECVLPKHTQANEELKCIVEPPFGTQTFESGTYYMCVKSRDNVGYKIKWETKTPKCGTVLGATGAGFNSFDNDFEIFVETVKFAGNPGFVIDDDYYDDKFGQLLGPLFDNYLSDIYDRDCQTFDCVFPIRFFGEDQAFQVSDESVGFDVSSGIVQSTGNFYELGFEEPLVNSQEISLDLEKANFTIPITSKVDEFRLLINGNLVFEEDIEIQESFLFDISPRIVPFGQNTWFGVVTNKNITKSTWNFGDGSNTETVSGRQVQHIYTTQNKSNFDVSVSVIDNKGISADGMFRVFVGDPQELANQTIKDYKIKISNITSKIDSFPIWIKTALYQELRIQNIEAVLKIIESKYFNASSSEDFQKVMLDLINLKIPINIVVSEGGSDFPLSVTVDSINVQFIEKISNEDVKNNSELKDNIVSWMNSRFDSKISYEHIAVFFDTEEEVLISKFKIETGPKNSVKNKTYLIFGQDLNSGGGFKENYEEKSISDGGVNYVQLDTSSDEVFEFFVFGEVQPESLGAYISPEIKNLPLIPVIGGSCNLNEICDSDEDVDSCPEDCSTRILKFTLWGWIVLFIVGFVAYVILQEWYKRRYLKHLFPEEVNLYNLINFIYNGRKTGLTDGQIKTKLSQNGWSGEKLRFAFRKIDGKRTGMLEIPIFKFLENKKVRKELTARQPRPLDRRFVRMRFHR
jgi:hypothetical protein